MQPFHSALPGCNPQFVELRSMIINIGNKQQLEQQLALLESRLVDLQARLPAHSISSRLLAELDEIDEEISKIKSQLEELHEPGEG